MTSALATYLGTDLLTEWDARDLVLNNDDPIGTWAKSAASTEGNNLAQSTAGYKPLYKSGTYPYAQFDGSDDRLTAALVTDPSCYFMVIEATSDGTTRTPVSPLSGANYCYPYLLSGTFSVGFAGTTPGRTPATAAWPDATRVAMCVVTRSDLVGVYYGHGASVYTITSRNSFAGTLTVGAFNAGANYKWSGKIYHVATAKALGPLAIQQGLAQLRSDWGISGESPIGGTAGSRMVNVRGGADQ